jgi:metallo-beta-lactamase class B
VRRGLILGLAALFTVGLTAAAVPTDIPPEWTRPTRPFHVVGPIYYVGTEGIAVYLVQTRGGLILFDGWSSATSPHWAFACAT